MDKKVVVPAACNWCIEDDVCWFVAQSMNLLYKYNIQTKVLAAVSKVPTTKKGTYQNPLCIKHKNLIYCVPYYADTIWYYNLVSRQWNGIGLGDGKNAPAMSCLLGSYQGIYYFFAMGHKMIYGLDLSVGMVKAEYDVILNGKKDTYQRFDGVLANELIYLVVGGTTIYEFNLETQQQNRYELTGIDDVLYKLSSSGNSLWLSGKKKEIYMWDKEKNTISIVSKYPEEFAIYDFEKKLKIIDWDNAGKDLITYGGIYCLNEKVWLFPQSGNKILYCMQENREIRVFEIGDEEETIETLDLNYRYFAMKFFLMYVRKERYLGIYSYKNKSIFEIDTLDMTYKNTEVIIDEDSLAQIAIQNFFENGDESAYLIYEAKMRKRRTGLGKTEGRSVGEEIYRQIVK